MPEMAVLSHDLSGMVNWVDGRKGSIILNYLAFKELEAL